MTQAEQQERREAGKAKTAAALERLDEATRRIVEDDEAFAEYLRLSGLMHNYSWGNRLLIAFQRPDAGLVAGFKRWKDLGRPVSKGAKGIQILAPMVRKFRGEPGTMDDRGREYDENGESVGVTGFRVAYVFSVHDTDGPDLELPAPIPPDDDSEEARNVRAQLVARAERMGLTVETVTGPEWGNGITGPAGSMNYTENRIRVNGDLPAAHQAKTLAHEIAHAVDGKREDRDEAETVAEGAAFVIAAAYGLDTTTYSAPYIARWAEDLGKIRGLLDRIGKVAGEILSDMDTPDTLAAVAAAGPEGVEPAPLTLATA